MASSSPRTRRLTAASLVATCGPAGRVQCPAERPGAAGHELGFLLQSDSCSFARLVKLFA